MAKKENRSIEKAFEAMDEIIEQLEGREITLEESFSLYQQGMELLKYGGGKIDTVDKKMLQMDENGEISEF